MRRKWLRVRPDGVTETVMQGSPPPGFGWVEVPQELFSRVSLDPSRFAPSKDGRSLVEKVQARLSVSSPILSADGSDVVQVMVIIPGGTELRDLELEVNGKPVVVQPNEPTPIGAIEPGVFRVKVIDGRLHVVGPRERVIQAVEPGAFVEHLKEAGLNPRPIEFKRGPKEREA